MTKGRPRIVACRKLPEAVEARLARDYDAVLNADDHVLDRDEILSLARDADGLIVSPMEALDAELIAALPETVRILVTYSFGHEHIDLDAAAARGIAVANTPDVLTDATADLTMLLLLGAARRAHEGEALVRSGAWEGWRPTQLLGVHLGGKRLGILGMGRIGRAVADRARAFGMRIHYSNRSRLAPDLEDGAVFHADPEDMLRQIAFLSLNCPATEETVNFLDSRRIALLPRGAVVVNSARGTLVDDEALIAALRSGHIAAAGLDVFAGEPDLHPAYRDLPNTFLLPHLGSATIETRNAMGFLVLDNLDAFFTGQPMPARVV